MIFFDFAVASVVVLICIVSVYILFQTIDSKEVVVPKKIIVNHKPSKVQAEKDKAKKKAIEEERELDALVMADIAKASKTNGGMHSDAKVPQATTLEKIRKEADRIASKKDVEVDKVPTENTTTRATIDDQGFKTVAIRNKEKKPAPKKVDADDYYIDDMDSKLQNFFRQNKGVKTLARKEEQTGTAKGQVINLKKDTKMGWAIEE